jgi:hypothetical protein
MSAREEIFEGPHRRRHRGEILFTHQSTLICNISIYISLPFSLPPSLYNPSYISLYLVAREDHGLGVGGGRGRGEGGGGQALFDEGEPVGGQSVHRLRLPEGVHQDDGVRLLRQGRG